MAKTAEEILINIPNQWNKKIPTISKQIALEAMEVYHKEKLREDIIDFLNFSRGKDYYKKYKQFADEVINEFLNSR